MNAAAEPRTAIVTCIALIVLAAGVAAIGARPYAGSWNDGSRLAAAESLVDGGGWTIDESIFVRPSSMPAGAPAPYPPDNALLMARGTLDRLLIDGRFVSDKTPVSSLMLAAEYQLLQAVTGIRARTSADRFCYWLTLLSSGLAFVIATAAMFLLAVQTNHSTGWAAVIAMSFAYATCAAAYSRHVNAHIVVLALFAVLMLALDRLVRTPAGASCAWSAVAVGTLTGIACGFDAALGPLALALALVVCAVVRRSAMWGVLLAAAPWVLLVYTLNWRIGHTLAAPNLVAEYVMWPGSPFDQASITGGYNHPSVASAVRYALDLVLGRRGLLLCNLPVLMAPLAAWRLLSSSRPLDARAAVWFALALSIGGWLAYALASTNHSGVALSIRWFIPLLAPLFYLVSIDLARWPADRPLFLALSCAGLGMGISGWTVGPWEARLPFFWWWLAAGLISAATVMARQRPRLI